MNHSGCDVHIKTIDFAVVNERGIVSKQGKVETGVRKGEWETKVRIPINQKIMLRFVMR